MNRNQEFKTDKQLRLSAGFTLIEMAIVMIVLGLIAGSILPLLETVIKRDKVSESKSIVKTARDELIGYILLNKKLPDQATFQSQIGHTIDAWQQDLFYIPAWDPNASSDICSLTSTTFSVCLDGNCSASNKKPNVLFIIGSKGSNFNRQTEDPKNLDTDSTDKEVRIYSYSVQVDNYTVGNDPNRPQDNFDDIVEFEQLNRILPMLDCP